MSDLLTYSVSDFIPYTSEVYFRLLERVGEAYAPLQFLFLALGLATYGLAIKSKRSYALLLLAIPWVAVGKIFFLDIYKEVNWAGAYFGWVFFLQGLLVFAAALMCKQSEEPLVLDRFTMLTSALLVAVALLVCPLVAPISGASWYRAEIAGLHPLPTVIFTFGILLLCLKGWWAWILMLVPVIWLVWSGLESRALTGSFFSIQFCVGLLLVAQLFRRVFRGR